MPTSPTPSPPDFSRTALPTALKFWGNLSKLGTHPLAQLHIVQARRRQAGYSDSPHGHALALRDILRNAIATLGPEQPPAPMGEKRWRPYFILNEHYLEGHSPSEVAGRLNVERDTYNHELARALDMLGDALRLQEETHAPPTAAPTREGAPFLAPPPPAYALVGRDDLLHALKQRLLADAQPAVLALSGLPGVGKTALATALAHDREILAHFHDGVLWAGLGRSPDLPALLRAWGTALGIPAGELAGPREIAELAQAVHTAIGLRRILLIADDVWQLEAAQALHVGGPFCGHLLTTRLAVLARQFAYGGAVA